MFLSCKKIYDGPENRAFGDGERLEAVRVWLLGGFQVAVGSRTLEAKQWRLRKAAILVKVLALAPMRRLPRERVMELLWPGFGKEAASNNLRQTLHAARKAFDAVGGSRYLASEEGSLVLCPENILWVDVEAFEEATAIARRSQSPAAYRATPDLYGGSYSPMTPMRSGRRRGAKLYGNCTWR